MKKKKKIRIIFVCENCENARDLIPVAKEFSGIGWQCESLFISLDKFYGQGVETELTNARLPFIILQCSNEKTTALSKRGFLGMAKVIFNCSREIEKLVSQFDIVVCGSPELIERTFSTVAKKYRKPTYCTYGGIEVEFAEPCLRIMRRKLRYFVTGSIASIAAILGIGVFENRARGRPLEGFTRVFVMGEEVKRVLVKQGYSPEQIVASGLPRLKSLFISKSRQSKSLNAGRLLYLTGACLWHHSKTGHSKQQKQLKRLCEEIEKQGWDFKIRIHPREDVCYYQWINNKYKSVKILLPSQDLYQQIKEVDLVISWRSTAVFEAIMLGKIGIFVEPPKMANTSEVWKSPYLVMPNIPQAIDFISQCFGDNAFAKKVREEQQKLVKTVISSNTPNSAKLIAEQIISDFEKGIS